jgi:hypothetical protein
VATSTKISTILHLASASNHSRMLPRVDTEQNRVGINHNTRDIILLEYGHANEARNIMIARACPPALVDARRIRRKSQLDQMAGEHI